jgi:beta-phosphoglucomutase-like phosphatase (HAD superfamily)
MLDFYTLTLTRNVSQEPNLTTEHVLVFEDAPTGVAAARAANMPVVMVPDKKLDPKLHEGADQVLSSLLEFDPGWWGLPPF